MAASATNAGLDGPTSVVSCTSGTTRWSATVAQSLADGDRASVVGLGGPSAGSGWTLRQADDALSDADVPVGDGSLPLTVQWSRRPRLVTPDGACTLYLVADVDRSGPTVLVIGDSLALGMVAGPGRDAAARGVATAHGVRLFVDGYSGSPWTPEGPPGTRSVERFRGAAATDPRVPVVVALGANDAILASVAAGDPAAWRSATDASIEQWVPQLTDGGRCVVLVTPPDLPVQEFGAGDGYAREAQRVNQRLTEVAARNGAFVAPFAEVSRSRHEPDGTASDWFPDDDALHPNDAGMVGMLETMLDTVGSCETVGGPVPTAPGGTG